MSVETPDLVWVSHTDGTISVTTQINGQKQTVKIKPQAALGLAQRLLEAAQWELRDAAKN